jgi:thymidine kinase
MSLELFLGPMFAGKSSAVLGVIRRNNVIGRPTLCLTSALDTRYTQQAQIVSHNKDHYPATAVTQLLPILDSDAFHAADCIVVEEAQFFADLREFVLAAVETYGKSVICVGLDGDSERRPFGQLLDLVPYADKIQKFTSLCRKCADGTEAIFTFRKEGAPGGQVSVGGQDQYEPLCRAHYLEGKRQAAIESFIYQEANRPITNATALEQLERCVSTFGATSGSEVYEQILRIQGALPSLR